MTGFDLPNQRSARPRRRERLPGEAASRGRHAISAKIIRENLSEPIVARRLITEHMQANTAQSIEANEYLGNMNEGYRAVLAELYAVAERGER